MRIFLDTNVLVSAYTARGLCAELLELILTDPQCSLLTGEVNLSELRSVLRRRPFRVPPALIAEIRRELRDQTIVPRPLHPASLPVRDPDDRWVMASAIAGERIYWSQAIKIFSTLLINPRCQSLRRENAENRYWQPAQGRENNPIKPSSKPTAIIARQRHQTLKGAPHRRGNGIRRAKYHLALIARGDHMIEGTGKMHALLSSHSRAVNTQSKRDAKIK